MGASRSALWRNRVVNIVILYSIQYIFSVKLITFVDKVIMVDRICGQKNICTSVILYVYVIEKYNT